MPEKNPTWTRARFGRNRVHWVAYDDRAGSEGRQIVAQGYAASLPEADTAARAALAEAGMYQARRTSSSFRPAPRAGEEKAARPKRTAPERPREYLFTRRPGERDETYPAAHLIVRKTAKRVYVTRKSFGPDQIGSEDERWSENEPTLALDRLKLDRDGSVYSAGLRHSDFYTKLEAARGDAGDHGAAASRQLALRPPFSLDDIKAAYRRKAFEVHPDRGGNAADFQAVEAAYRRLLVEAQAEPD